MKLRPKNWKTFQHYKFRQPTWIKLHRDLLDDRQFLQLPVESRALAPMLWLLAAETGDGDFDASMEELQFRLRADEKELSDGLEPLIAAGFFIVVQVDDAAKPVGAQPASNLLALRAHDASETHAHRKQIAIPEPEPEQEPEQEADRKKPGGFVGKADVPACRTQEVIGAYHAALPELPRAKLLPDKRKKAIAKLWRWALTSTKDDGTRRATTAEEALGWFRQYFERVRDNDFLMGRVGRTGPHANWKCSLDYLLTEDGMSQVIEKTGNSA